MCGLAISFRHGQKSTTHQVIRQRPFKLSDDDLRSLKTLSRRGSTPARTQTRAHVLDLLHRGQVQVSLVEPVAYPLGFTVTIITKPPAASSRITRAARHPV